MGFEVGVLLIWAQMLGAEPVAFAASTYIFRYLPTYLKVINSVINLNALVKCDRYSVIM